MFCDFVIFKISLIKTIVQVGTPEIFVMFCLEVIKAIFLNLFSHSGIIATSKLGVLNNLAQKGRFFSKTAEISPVNNLSALPIGLICLLPPKAKDFPSNKFEEL